MTWNVPAVLGSKPAPEPAPPKPREGPRGDTPLQMHAPCLKMPWDRAQCPYMVPPERKGPPLTCINTLAEGQGMQCPSPQITSLLVPTNLK